MEAARLPRIHADQRQLALVVLLLALAIVAWLITDDRMAGMDAGPGTDPGTLGFYVGVWVVMMAAMMFPSMWPMVATYARIQRARREQGKARSGPLAVTLFVGGYLLSWTLFGLAAYGVLELGRSLSLGVLAWDSGGPYVAGAVLLAAAVYQLTPAKDVCLRKCRGPLDFVLGYWKPGYGGALRMGVEHGAWCVGCCWALMAALFALGVMSIGWMALVGALIAVEKLLPWQAVANRGVTVVLAILALGVAFSPERVPGLTLPDSAKAHDAMMRMMGPGMEEMAPSTNKSTPSMEEMAPSMNKAAPSMEEMAPSMNKAAPSMEDMAPSTNKAAPSMEDMAPSTNKAAPSMEDMAPSTNKAAPSMEDMAPSTNKAAPSMEDMAPSMGDADGR